jgi:NitT/TauT family transport system ATP-binding protein
MIDGEPIAGPRRDVGIVFQQPTLMPWHSTMENVLLPIRTLGQDITEGRKRADALLKLVGLENFSKHFPYELSGGMQQRVAIARSLVHDPSVLLMDEPFAALDALTRESMMLELQRIWTMTGKTIVFITHSIPEAVFLSDRVIVLSPRPGRVIEDLTIKLERPRDFKTMAAPEFGDICNQLRELIGYPQLTEASA